MRAYAVIAAAAVLGSLIYAVLVPAATFAIRAARYRSHPYRRGLEALQRVGEGRRRP